MIQNTIKIPTYINWRILQIVKSHHISYIEWGNPQNEVIICSHALIRNSRDFDKIAEYLSKDFRVICFDVVGRGQSDWLANENCYNYDTYTNDALFLLKSLSIKSCHWIGTSMGGLIGMVLASNYPYLIKSLILNDVGPSIPGNILAKIAKYVAYEPEFSNFDDAKLHFKKIYANFGIRNEEIWDHLTLHSIRKLNNNNYKMVYDPKIAKTLTKYTTNSTDVNLWYIWYKLLCPILVLRGELSDILTKETIEIMQKKQNVTIVEIPNTGHAPCLAYKEEFSIIENWLNQIKSK